MKTYIYILIDPLTNQIRYVGKANNPEDRYKNHKNNARDRYTHKRNWIKSLKLNRLKPEIEVIDEVNIEEWKYWERFWISYYKSIGCNLTNYCEGGDGSTFGNSGSFRKGNKPWNYGTARPKIKKGFNKKCLETSFKKGFIPWNKDKKGYSTSKKGSSIPDEVRLKISQSLKGRESLKKKEVKQLDMNMNLINIFPSIKDARSITGIKGIGNVLSKRAKTAGGYLWQL